jgi:hypothetical protein
MHRHWPFLRAYLGRGGRCWLVTRVLATPLLWLGGLATIRVSVTTAVELVVMSIGLSFLDTYLRRERVLVANLAIHPIELATAFAVPAALAELTLHVVTRLT